MRDEFKPYPWKKVTYVDDDYFDNVETLIYNDQSKKLVKQILGPSRWNQSIAEGMIPETVKWTRLNHPMDSYLLTEHGRLMNTWNGKFKIPKIFRFNMAYTGNDINVNVEHVFELMGWKYDHELITQMWKDNGWEYRDVRAYNKEFKNKPKRRESKYAVGPYIDI